MVFKKIKRFFIRFWKQALFFLGIIGVIATSTVVVIDVTTQADPLPCGGVLCPGEPAVSGFDSSTLNASYEELINAWYANGNVTREFSGYLSVPWFSGDNVCGVNNLQSGSNCNIGTVDFTQYCMVTDELSQVGLALSMSSQEQRFAKFYNTTRAINSSNGQLPAWRILVNESSNSFVQCRTGINGNCDTASDASGRIINALFTASNNSLFTDASRKQQYYSLAVNLTEDMIAFEFDNTERTTALGNVSYWLKAGTQATLTGTDGAYSGYYGDVMTPLLQACVQTGNTTYCSIANQTWFNYLVAAGYTDLSFSTFLVPPGRSYQWDFTGNATASCTNTCNPDQWDTADAPRAVSMCTAWYYAETYNLTQYFTGLGDYCDLWVSEKAVESDTSWVFQYYQNGTNATASQNGYKAQGWQAQLVIANATSKFNASLRSALDHYNTATDTWDFANCAGIYGQAFSIRALGVGIGRDSASWSSVAEPAVCSSQPVRIECGVGGCYELGVPSCSFAQGFRSNEQTCGLSGCS